MSSKQTSSPQEATEYLFKQVLPSLGMSDQAHATFVYELLKERWDCKAQHTGTEQDLYPKVLANLERTVATPGFGYFMVGQVMANDRDGEIISFSEGDAVSINVCRTEDGLIHLCGNYFFR